LPSHQKGASVWCALSYGGKKGRSAAKRCDRGGGLHAKEGDCTPRQKEVAKIRVVAFAAQFTK